MFKRPDEIQCYGFGMVNSGCTYNRVITKLLDGSNNIESYVDDVLGHKGKLVKTYGYFARPLKE